MTEQQVGEKVPFHLEIGNISCPNAYCNRRSTPQCQRDCDAYLEFRERLIELAAEIFP